MRLAKITDNLYVNPQQVLEVQRSGTAVHVAYNLISSRDDKPMMVLLKADSEDSAKKTLKTLVEEINHAMVQED